MFALLVENGTTNLNGLLRSRRVLAEVLGEEDARVTRRWPSMQRLRSVH